MKLIPRSDQDGYHYKLEIHNTSNHKIIIIPQTAKVEAEWARKDGVPLPRKGSSRSDSTKQLRPVYLYPGDSYGRSLSLNVSRRDRAWFGMSDSTIFKEKKEFTCINGVHVTAGDEQAVLAMRASIAPFPETDRQELENDLKEQYGAMARDYHVLASPIRSNAIDLLVCTNVVTLSSIGNE